MQPHTAPHPASIIPATSLCEGLLGPYHNGPHVLTRRTPPWERDPDLLFCALQEDPSWERDPDLNRAPGLRALSLEPSVLHLNLIAAGPPQQFVN